VIALRVLPLSLMPVWNASSYLFVTLFAYWIMKEKPKKRNSGPRRDPLRHRDLLAAAVKPA
jgi:hypothetical protein